MFAEVLIIIVGLALGWFGYSWFTGANPSKILGIVTSVTTSGTVYATSLFTGFIIVLKSALTGGFGIWGYGFVGIWFGAIPLLWLIQGLNGWYHNKPFLKSMIR